MCKEQGSFSHLFSVVLPEGTILKDRYVLGEGWALGDYISYKAKDLKDGSEVCIREYVGGPSLEALRNLETNEVIILNGFISKEVIERQKEDRRKWSEALSKVKNKKGEPYYKDSFSLYGSYFTVRSIVHKAYTSLNDLAEGDFSFDRKRSIMKQCLKLVEQLHEAGYVLVQIDQNSFSIDEEDTVYLHIDRLRSFEELDELTLYLEGWSRMIAPECYSSGQKRGRYTDVYALGCLYYYILTGIQPVESIDRLASIEEPLKKPSELGINISEKEEKALFHSLTLRAGKRTATVKQFLSELGMEEEKKRKHIMPFLTMLFPVIR